MSNALDFAHSIRWIEPTSTGVVDLREGEKRFFSYHDHGIHGVNHYLETRIVYPMGEQNDPDLGSLVAYYQWHVHCEHVPLHRVIPILKAKEEDRQEMFFEDVDAIWVKMGAITSIGHRDHRGCQVITFRDKF